MIEIIEAPKYKCTCPTCGAKLIFDGKDIKSVSCDDYVMKMTIITKYIMCPKCDDMITLKEEGREWN